MDARRAFVVDVIAGAIAPAGQKVRSSAASAAAGPAAEQRSAGLRCNRAAAAVARQAAYADCIARDDSGAIAAFLDDASTSLLQASADADATSSSVCGRALVLCCAAARSDAARACLPQVSVAKTASGQLQVRLSNASDFPSACAHQVRARVARHGM